MVDYYAILGVNHDASQDDIKYRYRSLALLFHPDKVGPESSVRFIEIKKAYDVLSDPQKRSIYDNYGQEGLEALDSDMIVSVPFFLKGVAIFGAILLNLLFLSILLIIVFLSLLGAYVDGQLSGSWNYIKVFIPLYVVVGVSAVKVLMVTLIACCLWWVKTLCTMLAIFCALLLVIFISVVKNHNEKDTRCNRKAQEFNGEGCMKWRAWLWPAYLMTLFFLLATVHGSARLLKRGSGLWKATMRKITFYSLTRRFFHVLEVLCVGVFFILVGCRADEVIKTNYYVAVGIPFFVLGSLVIVEFLFKWWFAFSIGRDFRPNHSDGTYNGNASESELHHSTPYTRCSQNPQHEHHGLQREARTSPCSEYSAHLNGTPPTTTSHIPENISTEFHEPTQGNAHGRPLNSTFTTPFLYIFVMITILVGLIFATVIMLCHRLNFYAQRGTYDGVLSLQTALIPLYIIFSFFGLVLIIVTLAGWWSVFHLKESSFHAPQREGTAHQSASPDLPAREGVHDLRGDNQNQSRICSDATNPPERAGQANSVPSNKDTRPEARRLERRQSLGEGELTRTQGPIAKGEPASNPNNLSDID